MCERAGILLSAIFAGILSLNVSTAPAATIYATSGDAKSRFDVPAEPLGKALRDLAIQANRNISYEPSIVAGLQAPAVKGEFTVDDALALILRGTHLRAVSINENTIQILEKTAATKPSATTSRIGDSSPGANTAAPDSTSAGTVTTSTGANDSTTVEVKSRDAKALEEIVVTGTHIRGVSLPSPVIEIGREEIDRSGYTSIADLMLSLPQNFGGGYNAAGTVGNSQINSRYSDNPTGASVPNLRGLGPGSTLTLVDGHRMAAGLPGGGADISSIPIAAIDHIEVVTDSASAVYGSDAVAGVVNVILKRNYTGAETNLSYGFAPDGGGEEKRASQLFGTRWDSGDAFIAYEHVHQDAVDARDRGFASTAPEPNSLLPETQSNSVTLSATQKLTASTSVFVDGLYIARDADIFLTAPFFPAPAESPSSLHKYAVASGFNVDLPGDWKASVFGNVAQDETEETSSFLTTPSATPRFDERFSGTSRGIEANANGGIVSLPSGEIRLAVGLGYRREGFSDTIGTTSASLATAAAGDRNIRYAFSELSVPLVQHTQRAGLNSLDLVVSGRNERYSEFGGKTVPKVGFVYVPVSSTRIRATWGQAFRAPNLYDTKGIQQLVLLDLPNSVSSGGSSPVLLRYGGNPSLQPETANAWSVGADYSSPDLSGLQASTTFFDVKYSHRIQSIANPYTALTDPLNAFFVTPSPSAAFAQSVYDGYPPSEIFNSTGAPFDPAGIHSILDAREVNVASQTARGADLNVGYKIDAGANTALFFLNGTYLDLTQQNTPQAPQQTLSGLAFYPSKFRLRGGATWKLNAWALTGTVNYLPRETNNQVTPIREVGSWTTVDATLRFAPSLEGVLSGVHFGLAVINVFDRNPPGILTTVQGLNYDSSNTNPIGRFVSVQISKEW
jgi:iron complex outermembrane receptor protein